MLRRSLTLSLPLLAAARLARADSGFNAFLAGVRTDAIGAGVAPATVDRAFAALRPNPKVLDLDSRAPERTQSWAGYRAARLADARIAAGRHAMAANADALSAIAGRYGVDPAVIVAIWGLETAYGAFTGGFSVIQALATLAADGRRDGMFRRELIDALRILDQGHVTLARMTGSYAGAMGQPQFMPSSFLQYAVSFDGGSRRDIWDNRNDALASIANYLARSGWQPGEPWGQPVRTPPGLAIPRDTVDRRTLSAWMHLGVTRADGTSFSRGDVKGALVTPDGEGGDAYMTYANFAVIRLYNHSDLYALSVGLLADAIRA